MSETVLPARVVGSIAAVAAALGRHPQTCKTWMAAGCPHERGKYDLDQIGQWLAARGRKTGPEAAAVKVAEALRLQARADRERLLAMREKGDVLTAADLERRLSIVVSVLVERLELAIDDANRWGVLHYKHVRPLQRLVRQLLDERFGAINPAESILRVAKRIESGEPLIRAPARRRS